MKQFTKPDELPNYAIIRELFFLPNNPPRYEDASGIGIEHLIIACLSYAWAKALWKQHNWSLT